MAENQRGKAASSFGKPEIVGKINSSEIGESSGIAASACQSGVLWTHNDSGDENLIFALDEKGTKTGTFKVTGAVNQDWEDIAAYRDPAGKCFLYIGDIGNNARGRGEFTVYRVAEPTVTGPAGSSSRNNPLATSPAEAFRFAYPDTRHDAETLLVHPVTADVYVISKRVTGPAGVYKMPAGRPDGKAVTLVKLTDLSVPAIPDGFLTGGDISSDGRHVILCDYFNAYELTLPKDASNFDEIWNQKAVTVELGPREQGEAVAYAADGASIFATSEKKNSPLIRVKRN